MRMTSGDAIKVQVGLRRLDRAVHHVYCHNNYPGFNRAWNCGTYGCWSGNLSNTLQRHLGKVAEARLCDPSLPAGPTQQPQRKDPVRTKT